MDEKIIQNWNSKISPNDIIYHLGDVIFGNEKEIANIFRRLNGYIKIIFGNHCKTLRKFALRDINAHKDLKEKIEFLGDYKQININGQKIILCHYPILSWASKAHGSFMIHSHCHYNLPPSRKNGKELGKILDVGVDGNNFAPYSFAEIKLIMDKKPIFPENPLWNDHHRETKED